jgi:hypothetical protein
VVGAPLICDKFCTRSARYYLSRVENLPSGLVRIAGSSPNTKISTQNAQAMRLALNGGNSIRDRFNREYAALQLSMLSSGPLGNSKLATQLICFAGNFPVVTVEQCAGVGTTNNVRRVDGGDQQRAQ